MSDLISACLVSKEIENLQTFFFKKNLLKFAEEFDHERECEHKHTVENSRANAVLHSNLVEYTIGYTAM